MRTFFTGLLLLGLCAGGARAQERVVTPGVTLRLQEANAAAVATTLTEHLGFPVEVKGGAGRTITLMVDRAPVNDTLDRVARSLGGRWQRVVRVKAGGEAVARRGPAIDVNLTLTVKDLQADRALAIVARNARAMLVTDGDLTKPVSLIAANLPVESALDHICQQAGASWSFAYEIVSPDLARPVPPPMMPVPPAPMVMPAPRPVPVPLVERPQPDAVRPTAPAVSAGPGMLDLRKLLGEQIQQLLRVAPDQRPEGIQRFVADADKLFAQLRQLPLGERNQRLILARSLFSKWSQLYQGLPADQKREFQPVMDVLRKNLLSLP